MHEIPKHQNTPLLAPAAGLASRARGRIAAVAIALTAAA